MTELAVRIERLKPMRVAFVHAYGRTPEQEAWKLLSAWAKPEGLFDGPDHRPVYGFNNPPPTSATSEYGYELWISVDAQTSVPAGVGLKDVAGGLYAVTSCRLGPDLPRCWKALLRWVHTSDHTWRRGVHELERVTNPLASPDEVVVDLCLPIEE